MSKYEEYEDMEEFERDLVFVITPFTDELDHVYSAIKDECSKLGLKAKRADENPGSALIINEITELIIEAEFIICDLTEERPNVYYELGYAHGVGNAPLDIFLIAKEGTMLHFDVGGYRVQYYKSIKHLRSLIKDKFWAMVQARREIS